MTANLSYALGFIGAALMVASYLMKNMLPLRIVALVACVFIFLYNATAEHPSWPSLLLYGVMIPINYKKARHVQQLIREIERAKADTPLAEWLLPHMHRRAKNREA